MCSVQRLADADEQRLLGGERHRGRLRARDRRGHQQEKVVLPPLVERRARDQELLANDRHAFELAERSNEAMNELSTAVDLNTKAAAEMVNLLGTYVQR